jgi:hypothetical protein
MLTWMRRSNVRHWDKADMARTSQAPIVVVLIVDDLLDHLTADLPSGCFEGWLRDGVARRA